MELINLNGNWEVNEESKPNIVYKATVPGDIHNDLLRNNIIEEPYFSDNSKKCEWVAETDWRYTKVFKTSKLKKRTYLIFEGIDTIASIYLNGVHIADTENMFLKYRFDVTDVIKLGENKLEVLIHSIRKELQKYPSEGYFGCFNVQRIFVRKAQCHFSWDWAPDFPATGIWKDVYIESICDTYINDYRVKAEKDGKVSFFVNLPDDLDRKKERVIEIELEGKKYSFKTKEQKNFYILKIDKPKLWWPRNLGEQPLYEYKIRLFTDEELCDEKKGRFGIRDIRFEEKPNQNNDGYTCRLYVNDTPVYLKGSNWVPLDVMTGCVSREQYEKAIKLAYDANFTMLRVWGGGIYESDIFYEICDELGILVWQDFAYACADVPDNIPEFVEKAITEAEQQVFRLRNFTSLVLYCGGNEKTGSHGLNKKYGDRIIYYYIRGVVEHLDGTRPYFPSSPWGYGDIGNTQSSGDCHCNSYQKSMISPENLDGVGIENFRDALKLFEATIVSEIAVQGAPLVSSLRKYIPKEKMWPINDIYNLHFMRNPYDGTGKYFPEIQYEVAEKTFGKIVDLNDFCKKSSIFHSELLRADCEYHKTRIDTCSGTMTWMFNDIWPCGTWSVIDYYMMPMPAYYSLKRSYTSTNLIITKTVNGYCLYVVNETSKEVSYDVDFGIMDLFGNEIIPEQKKTGVIPQFSSILLHNFGEKIADGFMYSRGVVNGVHIDTSLFDKLWKNIDWVDPGITFNVEKVDLGVKVKIKSLNYARCVNIISRKREDLIYEDNYFDILPGGEREILIKGNNITENDLEIRNWLDDWDY